MKENEILNKKETSSARVTKPGELVSLISSSNGITRASLRRITGNSCRTINKLNNKIINIEPIKDISAGRPMSVYYSNKVGINSINNSELISHGVNALRTLGLKTDSFIFNDSSNLVGNVGIDDDSYITLNFIGIRVDDVDTKMSKLTFKDDGVINVLVVDGIDLSIYLSAHYPLKNVIVATVKRMLDGIVTSVVYFNKQGSAESVSKDFNFKVLPYKVNKSVVDGILYYYQQADLKRSQRLQQNFNKTL